MKITMKIAPLVLRAAAGVAIAGYYGPNVSAGCGQQCFSPGCGSSPNTPAVSMCLTGTNGTGAFACVNGSNPAVCHPIIH
jgi:hypothetical protein